MKLPRGTPLHVLYAFGDADEVAVGRLALSHGVGVFEYAPAIVERGLVVNPIFGPPVLAELLEAKRPRDFDGLHGVFADSLPDAWGRLLIERRASALGISYATLTATDLLAVVGRRGPGALIYKPAFEEDEPRAIDLDALADQAALLTAGAEIADIAQLERLGGSSGGARPKVLVGMNDRGHLIAGDENLPSGYEHWLVKFRSSLNDREDVGPLEAAYADMARAAGLDVSQTTLLRAPGRPGYFATKRFDRIGNVRRVHMATATGLLDVRADVPQIDYDGLLRLTRLVTRHEESVKAVFRRMVFNVLAHNRDDHAKQHAFLMDGVGTWTAAPSYDLTFCSGAGNEHMLAVEGTAGDDITRTRIEKLGAKHGFSKAFVGEVIDQAAEAVSRFKAFATTYGVSARSVKDINGELQRGLRRVAGASA